MPNAPVADECPPCNMELSRLGFNSQVGNNEQRLRQLFTSLAASRQIRKADYKASLVVTKGCFRCR